MSIVCKTSTSSTDARSLTRCNLFNPKCCTLFTSCQVQRLQIHVLFPKIIHNFLTWKWPGPVQASVIPPIQSDPIASAQLEVWGLDHIQPHSFSSVNVSWVTLKDRLLNWRKPQQRWITRFGSLCWGPLTCQGEQQMFVNTQLKLIELQYPQTPLRKQQF